MRHYAQQRHTEVPKRCVVHGWPVCVAAATRRALTVGKEMRSDPPTDYNRLNLDIRQCVAAVGRRVNTLCQGETGLRDQLALFQVYHNFVVPHASLRQRLPHPEATSGSGSAKVWRPCTPAMAAGLTHHVWSLTEVLCYRVPPWPQPHAR